MDCVKIDEFRTLQGTIIIYTFLNLFLGFLIIRNYTFSHKIYNYILPKCPYCSQNRNQCECSCTKCNYWIFDCSCLCEKCNKSCFQCYCECRKCDNSVWICNCAEEEEEEEEEEK